MLEFQREGFLGGEAEGMPNYRLDCQQRDSGWTAHNFWSADDDGAVALALILRSPGRCELYQATRWLATFDCLTEHDQNNTSANDNEVLASALEVS